MNMDEHFLGSLVLCSFDIYLSVFTILFVAEILCQLFLGHPVQTVQSNYLFSVEAANTILRQDFKNFL